MLYMVIERFKEGSKRAFRSGFPQGLLTMSNRCLSRLDCYRYSI